MVPTVPGGGAGKKNPVVEGVLASAAEIITKLAFCPTILACFGAWEDSFSPTPGGGVPCVMGCLPIAGGGGGWTPEPPAPSAPGGVPPGANPTPPKCPAPLSVHSTPPPGELRLSLKKKKLGAGTAKVALGLTGFAGY